eukprot:8610837-Pyramimonas_sp.AAC.1
MMAHTGHEQHARCTTTTNTPSNDRVRNRLTPKSYSRIPGFRFLGFRFSLKGFAHLPVDEAEFGLHLRGGAAVAGGADVPDAHELVRVVRHPLPH